MQNIKLIKSYKAYSDETDIWADYQLIRKLFDTKADLYLSGWVNTDDGSHFTDHLSIKLKSLNPDGEVPNSEIAITATNYGKLELYREFEIEFAVKSESVEVELY